MQSSLDRFLKRQKVAPQQKPPNKYEHTEQIDLTEQYKEDQDQDEVDVEDINCPICSLSLLSLSIQSRESHVELCLLRPNENKMSVLDTISSEKQKTTKTTAQTTAKTTTKTKSKTKTKTKSNKPVNYAPYFKWLTFKKSKLKIIVDGFNYTYPKSFVEDLEQPEQPAEEEEREEQNEFLYFLSHFHSDHYIGLSKGWNKGSIWSSLDSIKLVDNKFNVKDKEILKSLPFDEWIVLNYSGEDNVGVRIKLYDANHCPGGAIFMFEEYSINEDQTLKSLKKILHTGDFRVSYKHLTMFKDEFIDEIYLDTTYLNPIYRFPNQATIINETCAFLDKLIHESKGTKNSILNYFKPSSSSLYPYKILVGSYSIGKEKLFIELAITLKTKIFITAQRLSILSKVSTLQEYLPLFETKDQSLCMIHVVHLGQLKDLKYLEQFKSFKIIKIRPTGWTFTSFQKKLTKKRKIIEPKEPEIITISDDEDVPDPNIQTVKDDPDIKMESNESIPTTVPSSEIETPQPQPQPQPSSLKLTKSETIKSLFQPTIPPIGQEIQQSLQSQYYSSSTLMIPYSEHSSFKELSFLGVLLRYGKIIPTVNMHKTDEFNEWFREWSRIGDELRLDDERLKHWIKIVHDYYHD